MYTKYGDKTFENVSDISDSIYNNIRNTVVHKGTTKYHKPNQPSVINIKERKRT